MSFEDMNTLLTTAYCTTAQIASVSKPQTNEQDGPTYCKEGKTDSRFPCEGVWAASFNTALLTEVGEALANDSLYVDYNGMWIPGINIHRTPYGGRAHEYFSEDPYLTGMMAVAEINGIQRYGVIAYPKHFAFNDQEANRNGIAIWLNEQAAREIYLRPWRYACSPAYGNAHGVMSSFNRVGNLWTSGSDALVNGILRGEWGFQGYIVTDLVNPATYMTWKESVAAGTTNFDSVDIKEEWYAYLNHDGNTLGGDAKILRRLKEAVHHTLYVLANSNRMNAVNTSAKMVEVSNWWRVSYRTAKIGGFVAACAGLLGYVAICCISIMAKKKEERTA